MLRIEDDKGRKWVAFEGDPAYEVVKKLEKKGYRWIVLPTDYYTGIRQEPSDAYEIDAWFFDGQHDLELGEELAEEMEDEMNSLMNDYTDSGLRYIQLAECMTSAAV